MNYGDLLKWAKLKNVVIKTGEFKDTGNPARDLTPNEQAYMQALIDNMFGQFVQAVSEGRGMKFEDVKSIANGKVWTGEQAMSMKLIDSVGDFETAVADTAKSVGIKGEPTLVHPDKDRKTLMDLLLGDVSQYIPTREKLMEQRDRLLLFVEVAPPKPGRRRANRIGLAYPPLVEQCRNRRWRHPERSRSSGEARDLARIATSAMSKPHTTYPPRNLHQTPEI